MSNRHNYINPAFCQQSEFYKPSQQLCYSQNPHDDSLSAKTNGNQRVRTDISDNPIHNKGSGRYARTPVSDLPPKPGPKPRYAVVPAVEDKHTSKGHNMNITSRDDVVDTLIDKSINMSRNRYEIISDPNEYSVDADHGQTVVMSSVTPSGRIHRYAVIPMEDNDLENYETDCYNESSITRGPRYASIPQGHSSNPQVPVRTHGSRSPTTPRKSAIATQKLHELLTTPIKTPNTKTSPNRALSPYSTREMPNLFNTPTKHTSTPKRNYQSPKSPGVYSKAQQRLNYNVPASSGQQMHITNNYEYEMTELPADQRTTAIIVPRMVNSPSVYSEATSASMNKSWSNLSYQKAVNGGITVAAVSLMMMICGGLNSGLCLYMMSNTGRCYYLDLGLISGFACMALGALGFRSRRCQWLPNRNFISGYLLLTVFTLLNCCGLLVLLELHPAPGTPLNDVTSGAVSGLSGLTLILACLGAVTTFWCKAPPPDNRVASVDRPLRV